MTNVNGNGHHTAPSETASESHSVVRERTFDNGMDIDYLLGLLRNQRVTGTLRIDLSQGGIGGIRLEERQKLTP